MRITTKTFLILALSCTMLLGCVADSQRQDVATTVPDSRHTEESATEEKSPRSQRKTDKLAPDATVEDPNSLRPEEYDIPTKSAVLPGQSYCYYYHGDDGEYSAFIQIAAGGAVVGKAKNVISTDMNDVMILDSEIKGSIKNGRLVGFELLSMGDFQEKNELDWEIFAETLTIGDKTLTKRDCSNPMKGASEPPVWRK